MIWVDGRIIADDALAIPVLDRSFEHGLGLFETLRTWGGRPTLLERHQARMLRSAEELGIPIDPASLPDAGAVRALLEAEQVEGDRIFRITASGGTASARSVVWIRSAPLPAPIREGGAVVCANAWSLPIFSATPGEPPRRGVAMPVGWEVFPRQPRATGYADRPTPILQDGEEGVEIGPIHPPDLFTARHKTLNYWARRTAFEVATAVGYDEILLMDHHWGLTEASRSNLFLVIGDELITIRTDAPIVPGIMRQLILEVAGAMPLKTRQVGKLGRDELVSATEVFLTNAVRGIIPVARFEAPSERLSWQAPGPMTGQLQQLVARRLWPDRGESP